MKYAAALLAAIFFIFATGCNSPPLPPEPLVESVEEDTAEEDFSLDFVPLELELPPPEEGLPVSQFKEVWAYLVAGRERALNLSFPITDLVYFGAELDSYGKLVDLPNFRNVASFRGRKHLVVASNGRALTHFALTTGSNERKELVRDLLEAAKPYDGLQIDFENVPARDGEIFLSFLRELREGLGDRLFSIALPARTRTLQEDVYAYAKIEGIVDRILVMAYDEHWSGSAPGPIASMAWCQRVARYALDTVGPEKLIMGLPFYGRSWGSENPSGAYIYSSIEEIMKKENIAEVQRENGIPTFKYDTSFQVTVYYEDAYSLAARLDMYKKLGVNAVGFWRLGQEVPSFWSHIMLEK